ncbi:uncharacterized protein LOC116208261 [Punica granatum]|uniref:Uncharacterized protein LOC116208261 n=2 Tax=Punica granatum TaxID=22663 RepID=A0A6P8DJF4_PUNGR|nr:uncharacterized protein LOC116208261 [Punica granatum]
MKAANTPSLLQHRFHKHALVLQELSKDFSLGCKICSISVKGPAYHCIDCEFFLHKSCAELPPKIQHPSHPQHPLVFSMDASPRFRCYGCRNALRDKCYQCYDCEIDLHVGCAAATLPPPKEEEQEDEQKHEDKNHHEEEMIEHFAHDHRLASFRVDAPNYIECKACGQRISGRVYGCRACIFVLHESCALASREIINHPFHPQHPLTLLVDSETSFRCKVCERYCCSAYNCTECDFNLDMECAVSIVHPPRDDQIFKEDRQEINHFSHPHQLTSFQAKPEFPATCRLCKEGISGDFYCCPDCLLLLHPACAKLTQEIVHPLHPDHPLICQADFHNCSLCSDNTHGFGFKCEECPFGLHVGCALQSISAKKEELILNSELYQEHCMRLRRLTKGYACFLCKWPVVGLGYDCPEAFRTLDSHKTCAQLPGVYPIHPQHPLVLLSERLETIIPCSACLGSEYLMGMTNGFTFYCDDCKIQFHAHCAMRRPSLKHQRHEHSLSYFDTICHKPYRVPCNVCYDDCRIDFYRCVPCNYNLHFSCLPLPPSAKHEFHYHQLVLRDRFVDDLYDYEEQYCDVCETLRHPEHGVYYCEECNYDAHIDCVIPKANLEKRRQMEDIKLKHLDEQIANKVAGAETLKIKMEMAKKEWEMSKEKWETAMKDLEELKEKRRETLSS